MTPPHAAPQPDEQTFRGDLDVPTGLPRGIDLGRIANKDKAIAMYGRDLVEKLTDHALLADDYAYAAMLDFKDPSYTSTWRTFDQALEYGIDAVDDPSPGLIALFEQLDRVPRMGRLRPALPGGRGRVLARRTDRPAGPRLGGAIAGGFSMYSATRPVLFSGRLRKEDKVGTRLIESFRYVVAAYTPPGGMRRFEEGFRLTAKVRMITPPSVTASGARTTGTGRTGGASRSTTSTAWSPRPGSSVSSSPMPSSPPESVTATANSTTSSL